MTERESENIIVVNNDRRLFIETGPRAVPHYEFSSGALTIHDLWGITEIGKQPGDEVLIELSKHPLVRKTMSNEQLTLDKYTTIVPSTGDFSRWEHMWGGVAFIRKMSEDLELDDREKLILQLRAFVSDLGHTAYSHLGDWMFQGAGGSEDYHDQDLGRILEISGINDILRQHGIQPEEVIFPDINDWVESPLPELCTDRVDYGARQIKRCLDLGIGVSMALRPKAFKVIEGRLVMADKNVALNFAKAFLLLPTEHWSHPVQRLQLYLKEQMAKYLLTNEETYLFASNMDSPTAFHPRDYMYTFDFDMTWEMVRSWDPFLNITRNIMETNGLNSRRNFTFQRGPQLQSFFHSNNVATMPHPLKPYGAPVYQGLPMIGHNLSIIPVGAADEIADFQKNPVSYDVFLPALKIRSIDPLYLENDEVRRLSEHDENYKSLLDQQKAILAQAYVARLHVNEETKKALEAGVNLAAERWPEALTRPHMSPDKFKRMLGEVAMVGINHRFVTLDSTDPNTFSILPEF